MSEEVYILDIILNQLLITEITFKVIYNHWFWRLLREKQHKRLQEQLKLWTDRYCIFSSLLTFAIFSCAKDDRVKNFEGVRFARFNLWLTFGFWQLLTIALVTRARHFHGGESLKRLTTTHFVPWISDIYRKTCSISSNRNVKADWQYNDAEKIS